MGKFPLKNRLWNWRSFGRKIWIISGKIEQQVLRTCRDVLAKGYPELNQDISASYIYDIGWENQKQENRILNEENTAPNFQEKVYYHLLGIFYLQPVFWI